MKVRLDKIPNLKDLEKGYRALQHDSPDPGPFEPPGFPGSMTGKDTLAAFALYCQWVRFDSRLGEICVQYLLKNWKEMNPIALRQALLTQTWPNVAAVLLEFCQHAIPKEKEEYRLFKIWKTLVTQGFQKANWEQYYIGQRRIASRAMFEDVVFSLQEYLKWGYFGREILFNKNRISTNLQSATHRLNLSTRMHVIESLLEARQRITTKDYWITLGKAISVRQAERDLKSHPSLRSVGKTRARFFVKR